MCVRICGIIAARYEDIVLRSGEISLRDQRGYLAECVLPEGHGSDFHVFRTPSNVFVRWETAQACDCCEVDDPDRCFDYREITEAEFKKLCERRTS